jgi:tRNA dimethylallyltransferase
LAAPPVLAVFGPTAIGKTGIAIALAERLREQGEDPVAISADALQLYAGLETLTGAPTADQRSALEHRLVGIAPVTERFSVGRFAPLAHAEIDAALAEGRRPIVVGGTGLYLRAALCDLDLRPAPLPGVRERLEARVADHGIEALHAELSVRAPEAATAIDPTDRSRVIRALELAEAGEDPTPARGESQLWTAETRRPTALCGLVMDRAELYERIEARVDAIVAAGAREEVERAEAAGASRTARAALGYRELLAGDVAEMKRRTRNYAKRQLTWMRKVAGLRPVDITGLDPEAAAEMVQRSVRMP